MPMYTRPLIERPKSDIPKPKRLREVPKWLFLVTKSFCTHLFYILKLVWEAKPSVLLLLALTCLLDGVLPVFGAFITRDLMNALYSAAGGEMTRFSPIVGILVLWFSYRFFTRLVSRVSAMVTRIAGELVTNHVRVKILEKAKTVDLMSYDSPAFYEKLENANREAGHRPLMILSSAFGVISTLISSVSFIVILGSLHPGAPLLIIVMALPGAIVNYVYRSRNFNYMRHRSKERRQMDYYSGVVTDKDRVKEMRIMDLSDTFIGKYKTVFGQYYAGLRRLILGEAAWGTGTGLLSLAAECLLFVFVAYRVYRGDLAIGDYSLYTGALNSVASSVASLISSTASIYEGTLFIDNLIAFLKEKVTIRPLASPALHVRAHAEHTVEFRDVSFRYPGSDRDVIRHFSLTVHSGQSVALVGVNGAGKTTLIKLFTRLYDPTEGTILLDGEDIRNYDVRELYDIFGIIFQDFGHYAVSARENIAFGDIHREATDEAIVTAACRGEADTFIRALPNGYDTPLMRYFEWNGIELSIGQWQKLSIARAFYKDSDILILDEPTASLDPLAEAEVFNKVAEIGKDKMKIFVSHRLSSATGADIIAVLEGGELIECGTHEELMKLGGKYHTLFTVQASRYRDGEREEDAPPRHRRRPPLDRTDGIGYTGDANPFDWER